MKINTKKYPHKFIADWMIHGKYVSETFCSSEHKVK